MGTVALRAWRRPPTAPWCVECPPAQGSHSRWDFDIPTSTVRCSPRRPALGTDHPACCPVRSLSRRRHTGALLPEQGEAVGGRVTRRRRGHRTDAAGRQSRRPVLGGRVSADGRVGVRPLNHRGARWGANGEQTCAPNGPELHSTTLNGAALTCESHIFAGQRDMTNIVHT